MAGGCVTAGALAADALAFTRWAWRRAWGMQVLAAAGPALLFVGLRGRLSPSASSDILTLGFALLLVTAAPLAGALLRLRLGGAALRCLGPLGLQFGFTELRLVVLALAALGASLFVWLPVVAASAVAFIVFRDAGLVSVPGAGPLRVSFLVAAALWLAALVAFTWAAARLSIALPATVGKRRLVIVDAWRLSTGLAGAVVAALALTAAPAVMTLALAVGLDRLAVHDAAWGALRTWPLADAIVAGTVFGAVLTFVQAPLTVGVVAAAYCAQRTRRTIRTSRPWRMAGLAPA